MTLFHLSRVKSFKKVSHLALLLILLSGFLNVKVMLAHDLHSLDFTLISGLDQIECFENHHIDESLQSKIFLEQALKENAQAQQIYHVFSHGKPGQLLLKGKWSDAKEIETFLRQNITADAKEIYLYGCNFARGDIGKKAVAYLEQSLNVSISASNNITGQNGDWILENNSVDMTAVFAGYQHNLGFFDWFKSWFVEPSIETSEANASAFLACTPVPGQIDIEGTVYQDFDEDQTLDPGETGEAGIAVDIYRDINSDGQVDAGDIQIGTVNTDATGFYAYTFPPPSGSITDDFSSGDFTGGSGWSADWTVLGDAVIISGEAQVENNASIYRTANLGAASSATISFNYEHESTLEASDRYIVEICSDASFGTCQTLLDVTGDFAAAAISNEAINSNILTPTTTLRARTIGYTTGTEEAFIDNIVINYTNVEAGDYLIQVDTNSLASDVSLTTDNVESAIFTATGQKDCDNDFGYKLTDSDGDNVPDRNDLDYDNDGILNTDEGAFYVGNVVLDQLSAIPAGTYPNQITNKGLRLSDTSGDFILDIYVGPLTSDGKSANFDTSTGKINSTSGLVNLEFVEFIYTTESSPIPFELKQITIDNIGSLNGGTSDTQFRDAFTWAETGKWAILGTGGAASPAGAAISVVDSITSADNVGPIVTPDPDGNNDIAFIGDFNGVYNNDPDNTISDVLLNLAGTVDGHEVRFNFDEPQTTTSLYVFNSGNTSAIWSFFPQLTVSINQTLGPDTDDDGTPDFLDLDSDNDGCPDFIEGGGTFVPADGTAASGTVSGGTGSTVTTNLGITVGTTAGVDLGVPTVATTPTVGQTIGDSQNASVQGADCPCLDTDGDLVCDKDDLDDDNDGILDTDEGHSVILGQPQILDQVSAIPAGTYPGVTAGVRLSSSDGQFLIDIYEGTLTTGGSANFNTSTGQISSVQNLYSDDFFEIIYNTENSPTPFQLKEITINNINSLNGGTSVANVRDAYVWSEPGTWIPQGTVANGDPLAAVVGVNPLNGTTYIGDFIIEDSTATVANNNLALIRSFNGPYTGDPDNIISDVLLNMDNDYDGHTVDFNFVVPQTTASLYVFNSGGSGALWSFYPQLSATVDILVGIDTDQDGIQDHLDLDSDNDGCPDFVEGGGTFIPANGTTAGGTLTDGNGNIVTTNLGNTVDTTAGVNLGVPTIVTTPTVGQTIGASRDSTNSTACDIDTDGDGVFDHSDIDSDNDGIPDDVEIATASNGGDTDGDGIPDYLDLDSDNDGIPDLVEAGGTDTDGDGVVDDACNVPTTCDVDGDGLMDSADAVDDSANPTTPTVGTAGTLLPITDTDGDGNPDFQDLDSDNDGINDIEEAGIADLDNNGIVDQVNPDGTLSSDADGDGFTDSLDPNDNTTAGTGDGSGTPVTPADTDGDGHPDYQDLDSDNDGINDIVESGNGAADTNNDGIADNPNTDTDGDGIPDSVDQTPNDFGDGNTTTPNTAPVDTDNDNVPDYQDLDSDNDGVMDVTEGGNDDANGDGLVDNPHVDTDGDGIPDSVDDNVATFGDTGDAGSAAYTSDPLDENDGGTGVLPGPDTDGDGIVDSEDTSTNFGLEPDTDGDGVPDADDIDSDNDGIPDDVEIATASNGGDTDGDGIPDYLDLDSDNDGIPDLIEAGGTDTDGDGIVDDACNVPATCDVDGDGLMDSVDAVDDGIGGTPTTGTAGTLVPITDTDGDGKPDFQDLDSDNDGINDIVEAGIPDTDNNGIVDQVNPDGTLSSDADGDGFTDSLDPNDNTTAGTGDGPGTPVSPADTDGDGHPDYQDLDSDNDGINDIVESGNGAADANNDGIADNPNTDTDGDGIPDSVDQTPNDFGDGNSTTPNTAPVDTDGDNVPDYKDLDSDNDGVMDVTEGGNDDANGDGLVDNPTVDSDGDGIPDSVDDNDNTFGDAGDTGSAGYTSDPLDENDGGSGELPGPDTDGDGIVDSEDTSTEFGLSPDTCGSGTIVYAMSDGTQNTTGYQWDAGSAPAGDVPSANMFGLHRSTEYCESGGWRHYYNSNETDKFLFSIEMGSNTTEIEYVEIRVDETPENRIDTSATNATFVIARDWFVKTVGNAALTANVNIRFYYVPSELKSMLDGAIALANSDANATVPTAADVVWFKTDSFDPENDINADGTGITGKQGYTVLTPNVVANANGESEADNSTFGNGVNYVQFNGITGFSGGGAYIPLSGGTALPVELISFTGKADRCDVDLSWATATEENFSHYEVEWSEDGRSFEQVGKVVGSGTSEIKLYYSYEHNSAFESNYYRLKMVDLDGTFEYSDVIFVETDCAVSALSIYPNPVSKDAGMINLTLSSPKEEVQVEIFDALGHMVRRISFGIEPNVMNNIRLDISDLPSGSYVLRLPQSTTDSKLFIISE